MPEETAIQLEGVSETTLWTLHHRASEAARPDRVLHDPMAVELVDAIDFPFEARFGSSSTWSQWQALRARTFDREVRRFLHDHPDGTVIALGEGLETQLWRVNNNHVHWVSVDLPPVIQLRQQLLPASPRLELVASSVVDGAWLDEIDRTRGTLVTAQGLLMYLEPEQVHELIAACAARIPAGGLLFDAVPRWLSERTKREPLGKPDGYRPPPWTWGVDASEIDRISATPGVASRRTLRLPRGRGPVFGFAMPLLDRVPGLNGMSLTIMLARLGALPPTAPDDRRDISGDKGAARSGGHRARCARPS
jgi:O-methyltransferase involved in polyketide biosynthesis